MVHSGPKAENVSVTVQTGGMSLGFSISVVAGLILHAAQDTTSATVTTAQANSGRKKFGKA